MSTLCLFTNVLITLRLPRNRIFRDFYNRRLSHHPALAVLHSFLTPRIELQPPHLALEKKHVSRAKILRSSPKIAFSLPEIGDILRPRSIWHAVSNYQDGGIKKAVRRKNKD